MSCGAVGQNPTKSLRGVSFFSFRRGIRLTRRLVYVTLNWYLRDRYLETDDDQLTGNDVVP